jgi:hypothetical protein
MLRYDLSIPTFYKDFIMKGCWILPNNFSASTEIIIQFECIILLICNKYIKFIDLWYLNVLLNLVCFYLTENLWILLITEIGLQFLSCCIFIWVECHGILWLCLPYTWGSMHTYVLAFHLRMYRDKDIPVALSSTSP